MPQIDNYSDRCFIRFEQFADGAHSPCSTVYFPSCWVSFQLLIGKMSSICSDFSGFRNRLFSFTIPLSFVRSHLIESSVRCEQRCRMRTNDYFVHNGIVIGRLGYTDRLPRHFGRHRENERKPENKFKDQRPNTTKTDKFYYFFIFYVFSCSFTFMVHSNPCTRYAAKRWRRKGKRLVVHSSLVIFFFHHLSVTYFRYVCSTFRRKIDFFSPSSPSSSSLCSLVWNIDHTKSDLYTNRKVMKRRQIIITSVQHIFNTKYGESRLHLQLQNRFSIQSYFYKIAKNRLICAVTASSRAVFFFSFENDRMTQWRWHSKLSILLFLFQFVCTLFV